MKLLLTLTSLVLFFLLSSPLLADKTPAPYPEAYAGLNPNSYHPITLRSDKSSQINIMMDGTEIIIPLAQSKSSGSSNISFTQNIPNGSISATKGDNSLFGQMHLNDKMVHMN